jgi:hypothetical protein
LVKAIKNKRILIVFFKIIAFLVLIYFLVQSLNKVDWNLQTIQLNQPIALIFAVLLVPVNWLFEWLKWKETLRFSSVSTSPTIAFQAFCSGIVTGMLTPNMQGNFLGRIYYFERKYRIDLILTTLISNYGQFLMSLLFGVLSIFFLLKTPLNWPIVPIFIVFISALLFFIGLYFYFEKVASFFVKKKRTFPIFHRLKTQQSFRWKIIYFSLLRYSIFVIQFALLLLAFGVPFSLELIFWIWQVYLWVTISPSLFLGKLAIRESISLWALTFAGYQQPSILIASFSVWILNLFIPTIIAIFIAKKK